MKLEAAQTLAIQLMQMHGLHHWEFHFNRARRRMGVCFYPLPNRPGRVELSVYFVDQNDEQEVRDTILHEIAHALAGKDAGHGPLWKAVCVKIGAKPVRCGYAVMPKGHWFAQCPGCKVEVTRHKRPRSLTGYHCRKCGPEKGQLVWSITRKSGA